VLKVRPLFSAQWPPTPKVVTKQLNDDTQVDSFKLLMIIKAIDLTWVYDGETKKLEITVQNNESEINEILSILDIETEPLEVNKPKASVKDTIQRCQDNFPGVFIHISEHRDDFYRLKIFGEDYERIVRAKRWLSLTISGESAYQRRYRGSFKKGNKRAQRALGRSPEEKVKGHSGANNR